MDFSEWANLGVLALSATSLCHLTLLQLQSYGISMVDCVLIIACWLLVCSIVYVRGLPERSGILPHLQSTRHLLVTADSAYRTEDKCMENDVIESIHEMGVQSLSRTGVSPPTTPPTKFPEFFESTVESTTCRLVHLNAKRVILTADLAESLLAVESRYETKRAAMGFYFTHLRTTATGSFRRLNGVGAGEAAYLKARDLYSEVLRTHREKEEVLRELLREIAELEKTRQKEKEKEKADRRASGKTLVEHSDELDVGKK